MPGHGVHDTPPAVLVRLSGLLDNPDRAELDWSYIWLCEDRIMTECNENI